MKKQLIFTGLVGIWGVCPAFTQEPGRLPETVVEAKRLKGVVPESTKTAAKTEVPLIELPQSVSTINRAEIDQRGAESAEEAVRYVPGVLTGIGGVDSRVDDIAIRGFEAGGFTNNVYLDGLRVAAGGQWTRSQFDIFGLEQIDILKGPSSVLYGQVAPGGLVNLVSKRPKTDAGGLLAFRYGSFDTWQVAGDSTGPIDSEGKFSYRIAGLYREGGAQVDHTDLSRVFIAPSLTWKPTEATTLTLLANYQDDHGGSTYQFLPVAGTLVSAPRGKIDRDTFIGEPDFNTFDREQYSVGYELEHRFDETWSLQQNLRFASVDTFYESIVAGRLPPDANGLMTRRAVRGVGDAWNLTMDTRVQAEFSTGPLKHIATGGFDFIRAEWNHDRSGTNSVPPINIFDPIYTGISGPFAAQVGQDVVEEQKGVYYQHQLEWGGWRLMAGGRYDWSEVDLENTLTGVTTKTDAEEFSGRVGLLYLFDNGLAPYGSFATSFEPVSGAGADGRAFEPTNGKQFEVGLKYEPKAFDALFTLSAFHLTQENVLTLDPDDITFQTQTGEIELKGIELEGKVALSEGLSLVGGLTWLDSEITENNDGNEGHEVGAVPEHMASLWLDYTFSRNFLDGLGIGAGVRYVGSRYGDNGNQFHMPSYTLFDAAIRYDLGKLNSALQGARVSLNVTNLEDKTYVAKAETATSANFGLGRVVSLGLSYEW